MAFITGFLPFVSVFKLKRIDGKKRSAALKIIGKTNTRFGDVISPDIANIEKWHYKSGEKQARLRRKFERIDKRNGVFSAAQLGLYPCG